MDPLNPMRDTPPIRNTNSPNNIHANRVKTETDVNFRGVTFQGPVMNQGNQETSKSNSHTVLEMLHNYHTT